jgi:hypothetical protein
MEAGRVMTPDIARDYDERGAAAAYSVLILDSLYWLKRHRRKKHRIDAPFH